MKETIIISALAVLLISSAALAQNSNPDIPKGAQVDRPEAPDESSHGVMPVPLPEPSPSTMAGGLYRLGNGYLSCPDAVSMTNGQPNLRSCTYVKDLH